MPGMGSVSWYNTEVQPTSYSYGSPTIPDNNTNNNGLTVASPSSNWIDQALQQAQSTDDPTYWYSRVGSDPKALSGDPSAIAYWQGRIAQGDGALAVRTGQVQKFNDSSGSNMNGLSGISDASLNTLNQTLQDFMKQQNTPKNVMWTGSQKQKPTYGFNPSYGSMNSMNSMNPSNMNNNNGYTSGLKSLGFGG